MFEARVAIIIKTKTKQKQKNKWGAQGEKEGPPGPSPKIYHWLITSQIQEFCHSYDQYHYICSY